MVKARNKPIGEERLARAIILNRPQAPSLICQALLHEALTHAHTAAFEDDATVVVLKQLMAPAGVR